MDIVAGVGYSHISEKAKTYVMEALDNPWFIHGKFVQRLEKEFSKEHECTFGIVTNSGTSSLHIAIQALKELHQWNNNDEVIVPAVTFVATANVVIHNNLKPVFVDVDPDYYELDPNKLEEKITEKTRAILPVHLFGQPCDMDPIMAVAKKYDLKVVEDSCETMFASYKGKRVGSFGDIGCFSTYVAHIISSGVGGISTTNNPDYAIKLRSLMNHGRDSIYINIGDSKNATDKELEEIIAKRFSFINVGHSFRLTEMEGAIACAELEDHAQNIRRRQENAAYLIDRLQNIEQLQLPKIRKDAEHSFMMFPIVLKDRVKAELVNYLEQHGVETRDMLPLVNQPIYTRLYGTTEDDYPVAKWINHNGFYVGCHQHLDRKQLDHIATTIRKYFEDCS
ncbi:MAG: DegT/DnrJ/EryC1/StrS family aminotransferase [archaeon]